jgi:hypothetical protein
MPALPKNIDLDPDGVSAWNLLLAAEDAALKKDASPIKSLDEVIARLLHTLRYLNCLVGI